VVVGEAVILVEPGLVATCLLLGLGAGYGTASDGVGSVHGHWPTLHRQLVALSGGGLLVLVGVVDAGEADSA